jgi:methionyl-tRNA formyltransferase
MKFSIAASDGYQGVLEAFLAAGWQLEKLFVCPRNWMHDNKQVIARALEMGIEVQESPITERNFADLGQRDCIALAVASYQWKIPEWNHHLQYAINFHPSPLPEARGPYPLVRAILEDHSSWAVSCHKINNKYDQGDILDTENFPLGPDECHESLRLKSQMAAARLAARIANWLPALWSTAIPQSTGSYWPLVPEQERTLDFTQPVDLVMRKIRAFGDLNTIAKINEVTIFVHRASGWNEAHAERPGTVVHSTDLALVVAVPDGLLAITEWSFMPPGSVTGNLRR